MCRATLLSVLVALACIAGGCTDTTDSPSKSLSTELSDALPEPVLPASPGSLSPTHVTLVTPYDPKVHLSVDACLDCHPGHVKEWRESTHHLASFNNPFYRASFEDYVAEVGRHRGTFCAGCHDPALLSGEVLSSKIQPEDHRAHVGITCMTCHGVTSARPTGVGSYNLSTHSIAAPIDDSPESLARHKAAMANPALKGDALCISCHKGFLSKATGHSTFVPALDEHRPWRESGWNGSYAKRMVQFPERQSCRGCHMTQDEEGNHSHRFAGGHATLAQAIGSTEQLSAIETMTKGKVSIALERGPASTHPNRSLEVDVVIVNQGVGHRFPGGARDLRDAWIQLELLDKDGVVIASSGTLYEKLGKEDDVHRLRVGLVDSEGELIETHGVGHFRTPAFDHTIAPKDAAVARYQLSKDMVVDGVELRARLLQRRLTPAFHAYGCQKSRVPDGKAFLAATKRFTGLTVDPCKPQPILVLAEASTSLDSLDGAGTDWERSYWHGVGLTHDLQERARHAIEAFREALRRIPVDKPRIEVMIRTELARALLRAGKTGDALKELELAEVLLPTEPVIFRLRADALRQTWKLSEMIQPLKEARRLAPDDAGTARELALAYGSTQEHRLALEASQEGLRLEPRDTDLLRLQMLAYKHLAPAGAAYQRAEQAFLEHKRDEQAPSIKIACSRSSKECLKEQLPIPTRTLKPIKAMIIDK